MPQYVVERHLPNFTGEMVAAAAKRAKQTTLAMTLRAHPSGTCARYSFPVKTSVTASLKEQAPHGAPGQREG